MTVPDAGPALLGTKLQALLDLLDGDVALVYADLGLTGLRPRYAPILRRLLLDGPASIRDLARATGVTHSAASQTVAQLTREGLVALTPGEDARQRIATATARAERIRPALETEWAATTAAATALEAELPYPLSRLIDETVQALRRTPMRERIAQQLR